MKRFLLPLLAALLHAAPAAGEGGAVAPVPVAPTAGEGYYLVDATAASVEGEVLFRSDVEREACMIRCGAFPGEERRTVTFREARRRLVEETAILQEQRRLSLGSIDNGILLDAAAKVRGRLENCPDPCGALVPEGEALAFAWRRLLVRDFLERRVSAFVEVTDEEAELERARIAGRRGVSREEVSAEEARESLAAAKREQEIARWREGAASKARVVYSRTDEEEEP